MSLVLREVNAQHQLGELGGKVNQILFMDDLKLYGQNQKQIDTLVSTVRIFSKTIGMEFRICKCATIIMKRFIISRSESLQLLNDEVIKNIEDRGEYRYLCILEADGFKNLEMKEEVRKEYFCEMNKILR